MSFESFKESGNIEYSLVVLIWLRLQTEKMKKEKGKKMTQVET